MRLETGQNRLQKDWMQWAGTGGGVRPLQVRRGLERVMNVEEQ